MTTVIFTEDEVRQIIYIGDRDNEVGFRLYLERTDPKDGGPVTWELAHERGSEYEVIALYGHTFKELRERGLI